MIHRRSPKRRRLPYYLAFSSFSRALSLVRCASAGRARVSEHPPASTDRALSLVRCASAGRARVSEHSPASTDAEKKKEAPAKIKRVESSPSDVNFEEEHQQQEEILQADFGFFDPKPGDFYGVKLLLQNYLDEKPWDLSGFVDLILVQTTVGTVVKLDGYDEDDEEDDGNGDDEDLYAVISALNLGRYGGHQCIGELKEFILGICGDVSIKKKLNVLLLQQASDVGLLVSQRFVNCPNQLVLPLYDALFDEVSWAIEDEPTQELKDSFCFKYYLLVTKIYENKYANQFSSKAKHDSDEPIIYLKTEDEVFHEMSSFSFTFHLHASPFVPHELKNYRAMGLVMVINADVVPKFRQKLKSILAES